MVWGLVGGKGLPPSPPVVWVPPPCCVAFGGVEFVLGSLGGLVVVVKLLCGAPNHILWEKILFSDFGMSV